MSDPPRPPFDPEWLNRITRSYNEMLRPLRESAQRMVGIAFAAQSQRQMQAFAEQMHKQLQSSMPRIEILSSQLNASIARDVLRTLGPALERMGKLWRAELPANWLDLDSEHSAFDVLDLMAETSWCLVWIPRADVLRELLDAPDRAAKERVLLGSSKLVADDLLACLDDLTRAELADELAAAREAVHAFADGHYRSAQALVSSTIMAIIELHFFKPSLGAARQDFAGDPRKESVSSFRAVAVESLVPVAIERYPPGQIPPIYNRNASAHTVSSQQFSELNSLTSLMLVVAFLKEVALLYDAGS